MIPDVSYLKVDDKGLHVEVGGEPAVLAVDTVVVCAGQEPKRDLYDALVADGQTPHGFSGRSSRSGTSGSDAPAGLPGDRK